MKMDVDVTEMLEEFMGSALVTWVGGKQIQLKFIDNLHFVR